MGEENVRIKRHKDVTTAKRRRRKWPGWRRPLRSGPRPGSWEDLRQCPSSRSFAGLSRSSGPSPAARGFWSLGSNLDSRSLSASRAAVLSCRPELGVLHRHSGLQALRRRSSCGSFAGLSAGAQGFGTFVGTQGLTSFSDASGYRTFAGA